MREVRFLASRRGAVVDFYCEFPHVGHGNVAKALGVGNTKDQLVDLPSFFDEFDF